MHGGEDFSPTPVTDAGAHAGCVVGGPFVGSAAEGRGPHRGRPGRLSAGECNGGACVFRGRKYGGGDVAGSGSRQFGVARGDRLPSPAVPRAAARGCGRGGGGGPGVLPHGRDGPPGGPWNRWRLAPEKAAQLLGRLHIARPADDGDRLGWTVATTRASQSVTSTAADWLQWSHTTPASWARLGLLGTEAWNVAGDSRWR